MNRKVIGNLLMVGVFGISDRCRASEPSPAINLTTIVQNSLDRSPALKSSEAQVTQAKSGLRESKTMNWPSLSWLSSVTRGDNPVYVFGSLLEQQKFGPQNFTIDSLNNPDYLTNIKNSLVLGLPIFTGLEFQTNEKIGKLQLDQARIKSDAAAQNIRLQAITTTLQVLLTRDTLAALEERIKSSEQELESARKLNARGLVLGSDFYAAQAILSGLESQKKKIQKNLQAAHEQLFILSGNPAEPAGALSDKTYALESDEILLEKSLSQRPDLKIIGEQSSMANAAYRQSTRSFWPKINAFASVETNTEDFSSNPSNRMIGVQSNFPLGDPSYFSRKENARARLEEVNRTQENVQDQARMDFYQALRRYQGAAESLPDSKQTVERAQKSLELFRPLYREGRQSIIEVLRAEEGLVRAQFSYFETLFQLHAGYAQLQLVTGSLDHQAVAEIEKHLETR